MSMQKRKSLMPNDNNVTLKDQENDEGINDDEEEKRRRISGKYSNNNKF